MAVPILVSSEEGVMSDETASHVRYIADWNPGRAVRRRIQ